MPTSIRVYWGRHRGRLLCTLNSAQIQHQSVVLVAASEGRGADSTAAPDRFVGDATFRVANIAPFDGGVRFIVEIGFSEPLRLWTDIVVMDGFPRGFLLSGNADREPHP